MDDFNYDNSRIDAALGGHLEDGELHLGAGERERYLRPQVETFSYTGDGETTREVALPLPRRSAWYIRTMPRPASTT